MKRLYIVLGLSLTAGAGVAQTQPNKTTLFQGYKEATAPPEEAVYRVERTENYGQTRLDSVFYVATRRLLRVSTTTWQPNGDTLTTTTDWRANGRKASLNHLLGNKAHGEALLYGAAGNVERRTVYERGKEKSAECFSETGAPMACANYVYTEKMPEFPGGQRALLEYIGSSVRYPRAALKSRQQGNVFITFMVDETGQVRNVQVEQGVSQALDAEALRVMKNLPRFEPGQQNGEAVPVAYTVPVTFRIR